MTTNIKEKIKDFANSLGKVKLTHRDIYHYDKKANFTNTIGCLKSNYLKIRGRVHITDFIDYQSLRIACKHNKTSVEYTERVFLVILLSVISKIQVTRFSGSVIAEVLGISERSIHRSLNALRESNLLTTSGDFKPQYKSRESKLNIHKKKAKSKLKTAFKKAKYEAVKFARRVQAGEKQVFKFVKVSKDYMSACYRAFKAIGKDKKLTFSQRIGRSAFVLKKAIEEAGLGFDSDQIKRGLSIMFNKYGEFKRDVTGLVISITNLLERLLDKGSEVV